MNLARGEQTRRVESEDCAGNVRSITEWCQWMQRIRYLSTIILSLPKFLFGPLLGRRGEQNPRFITYHRGPRVELKVLWMGLIEFHCVPARRFLHL